MIAKDDQRKEEVNLKIGYRSWATEFPDRNYLAVKGKGCLSQKKALEN